MYTIQCYRTTINKHAGTEVSVSCDDDHVAVYSLWPIHNGKEFIQIRFEKCSFLSALACPVDVKTLTKEMKQF